MALVENFKNNSDGILFAVIVIWLLTAVFCRAADVQPARVDVSPGATSQVLLLHAPKNVNTFEKWHTWNVISALSTKTDPYRNALVLELSPYDVKWIWLVYLVQEPYSILEVQEYDPTF